MSIFIGVYILFYLFVLEMTVNKFKSDSYCVNEDIDLLQNHLW